MNKSTFIIAEKNYLIRRGVIATLQELTHAIILNEVDDDDKLLAAIEKHNPDFVVVNTDLCEFCKTKGGIKKVVSPNVTTQYIGLMNKTKNDDRFGFDATIYIEDSKSIIADKLNSLFKFPEQEDELTQREKDIVRSIALGKTNKEIGEMLFISPHTVITHRKNITHKLGIKSVSGLTVYAILNNLINVDEVND